MSSRDSGSAAPVDLADRTFVVTGTSTDSLGFATARCLADWGAQVAVSTRSDTAAAVAALTSASSRGTVIGHPLDLCSAASVSAYADWLTSTVSRVDVLINNAGVHLDLRSKWTEPTLTPDGFEIHWRTNYLGSAHLTSLLLPALSRTAAETGEARVVNVVSKLHSRARNEQLFTPIDPYNSWTAYGASKLAMIHHANGLQRRFGAGGLRAYSLHPGSVFTRIADKGLAGNRILSAVRHWMAPIERRMLLTPEEGAQTSLYCATAPDLTGGRYYRDCAVATPSADTADASAAERLWTETQAWINAQ